MIEGKTENTTYLFIMTQNQIIQLKNEEGFAKKSHFLMRLVCKCNDEVLSPLNAINHYHENHNLKPGIISQWFIDNCLLYFFFAPGKTSLDFEVTAITEFVIYSQQDQEDFMKFVQYYFGNTNITNTSDDELFGPCSKRWNF